MTLQEFLNLPVGERRARFCEMSTDDQCSFIDAADPIELIMGAYPSESMLPESKPRVCSAQIIRFPGGEHGE